MDFILCSSALVICLVSQVSSQPPAKPTLEWSPLQPTVYPNPWVNFAKCNRPEASGLCDVNSILTEEQRNSFGNAPEFKESADQGVCTPLTFKVTVALMKQIGPHISDYRAAAADFAKEFRTLWTLSDCSVTLIASQVDSVSFLEAGSAVKLLLSVNVTEELDLRIYETYFKNGLIAEGLNKTLIEYRELLEASQTTQPNESGESGETNSASKIIVGVIVCALGVLIIVITVIIVIRFKGKARKVPVREVEHLTSPKAV